MLLKNKTAMKFRFWDKVLKKMRYKMYGVADFSHNYIIPMLGVEINGVLVYDGDLLESKAEVDGEEHISNIPVVFENGALWVDESFKKDGTYLHLLNEWDEEIKVIGNIYEN